MDPTKAIAVRINPIMERDAPIYVSIVNPGSLGGGRPILGWIAYEIITIIMSKGVLNLYIRTAFEEYMACIDY